MTRKRIRKTSIVPLVVLQAACAGVASVTPACGETERSSGSNSPTTAGSTVSIGMGGTVIVLAVNGFGGNVIAPPASGYGGVPGTSSAISGTITATATASSTTTGTSVGAGGSLVVLAVAGFGGQLGSGGEAGALGQGGQAGAPERQLDPARSRGQGSG